TAAPGILNGNQLATATAGVQVTFDGVAVPLLSVSAGEIDLLAPLALAGKTTTIQVQYNGAKSNAVQVAIAIPARYAGVPSGIPLQVLGVFNPDFTVNSPSNAAPAGSVMTLYCSGAGQTVPPSQDGQVNAPPLAAPSAAVTIDNLQITFAGAAANLVAGILQVNFVAPAASTANLNLTIGQAVAQFN